MNIIDMHCDTIMGIYMKKKYHDETINLRDNKELHISLENMKKGDYLCQCFAMFVPFVVDNPYQQCKDMIDIYQKEIIKNNDMIRFSYSYDDILNNQKNGYMSSMLTIEGAGVLNLSLDNLKEFYDLGVRMITLTWNYPNGIAYPNIDMSGLKKGERALMTVKTDKEFGLTDFGKELVKEMNRLGIIIDASHVSDATFYDLIELSDKPFVCSHSNSRVVAGSPRNLTDDMIKKLAEKGGVTGINYAPDFIKDPVEGVDNFTTIEATVEQINHLVKVGGIDFVGLGSDFDGISHNLEFKDCSDTKKLITALKEAGYTNNDIDKITHLNVLRVFKEVLK